MPHPASSAFRCDGIARRDFLHLGWLTAFGLSASDILRGQVPVIRQLREEGHPWSDALSIIATSYYNRNDPSKDRGR